MKKVVLPLLSLSILLLSLPALAGVNDLEIYQIAVGQADSALIRAPEDPPGSGIRKTLLIDSGRDYHDSTIVSLCSQLGISRITYSLMTHLHSDHLGGFDGVVASLGQPDRCFDRGGSYSSSDYGEYASAASGRRRTVALGDMGSQGLNLGGGVSVICVSQNGFVIGGGFRDPGDENGRSVGVVLSYGNFEMLIAGDLTDQVEPILGTALANPGNGVPPIDVYKVHHHGSHNSSHTGFLAAMGAEVSILSTGNTEDHLPKCSTFDRLCAVDSTVYQTNGGNPEYPACAEPPSGCGDLVNGTVKVFTDGDTYRVTNGSGGWDTFTCDTATVDPSTIYEIQDTSHPNHPGTGATVTIEDVIVTAVVPGGGAFQYFVEESAGGPWSGVLVYDLDRLAPSDLARGDRLDLGGVTKEYYGLTEIETDWVLRTATGQTVPGPDVVTPADIRTGGPLAERYEGVLVRVLDVEVTDTNPDAPGDYGEFEVDGLLRVDDLIHGIEPALGEPFGHITGPLYYGYSNFKIEPRDAGDLGAPCPDGDQDGYTDDACGGTDCDDTDGAVNPGADEDCANGVDDDCDGLADGLDPACEYTLDLSALYVLGTIRLTYTVGAPEATAWANYLVLTAPALQVLPLWTIQLPTIAPAVEIPVEFPIPSVGVVGIYSGLYIAGVAQATDIAWVDTGL